MDMAFPEQPRAGQVLYRHIGKALFWSKSIWKTEYFAGRLNHQAAMVFFVTNHKSGTTEEAEDRQYSAALAHEDNEIPRAYFRSIGVIASVAASAIGVVCALWGFAPAAAITNFIAKDISEQGRTIYLM
jgi:hypothetical protein